MSDERKDLQDIECRSFDDHRWLNLLRKYVGAMHTTEFRIADDRWPIAGALLWLSVMKINSGLGELYFLSDAVPCAPPEDASEVPEFSLKHSTDLLSEAVPLVAQLRDCMPEQVTKFDEIVIHGKRRERSWLQIALNQAEFVLRWWGRITRPTELAKAFKLYEYDPNLVRLQLEIEERKFRRIEFYIRDRVQGETIQPKTTVGEYLKTVLFYESVVATSPVKPETPSAGSGLLKADDPRAAEFRDGNQWCDAKYAETLGVSSKHIDRARKDDGLYGVQLTARRKCDAPGKPFVYRRAELNELADAIPDEFKIGVEVLGNPVSKSPQKNSRNR